MSYMSSKIQKRSCDGTQSQSIAFGHYIILVLFSLALSGCNPIDSNKVEITLKHPNADQIIPFNITVSNIQVINHQVIITGTNLTNVTMFKINEGTNSNNLQIESKTSTSIVANTLASVSFAAGKVFNFILSNASAASTFTVNFSLCDSSLGGKAFACALTPNDRDVLSYNAGTGKWEPRSINGLSYQGAFSAAAGSAPVSNNIGDYYIISVAGTIGGVAYHVHDWIVLSSLGDWEKIDNSNTLTSVFGRTGVVTATKNDYSLTLMSDVDFTSAPTNNQFLKFNGSNWIPATITTPAESDPTVTAFAKNPLPNCTAGQVLKSDGAILSCVTDQTGAGSFTGAPNVAIMTNGSGGLTTSTVTSTELGYLSGVTSAIQTQLNAKSSTNGSTSITALGTIATGTWNGTVIDMIHGGTGANITGTIGGIPYFNSTSTMATSSQLLLNGIVLGGGTTAPGTISLGTSGQFLTSAGVAGPPIWTTTLPIANGGTGAASTSQNFVFAGPTSGAGTPNFRALAVGDLPASASYWVAATGGINYAGGNIGIGTTAPGAKLDINGNIKLAGSLVDTTTGTSTDVADWNLTRNASYSGGTVGYVNSGLRVTTNIGSNVTAFEWSILGISNSSSTGGENVGVYGQANGTSTGPVWGMVAESNNTGGGNAIGIEVDSKRNVGSSASAIGIDVVNKGNMDAAIRVPEGVPGLVDATNYSGQTPLNYISFPSSGSIFLKGNVGIGTSSPAVPLHVTSAGDVEIRAQDTLNAITGRFYTQTSAVHMGTSTNHSLLFETNGTEKMRITNAGNIGIGITNPSALLHVNNSTSLGVNAADESVLESITQSNGNANYLNIKQRRHTAGANWAGTQMRMQRVIDSMKHGFIDFGIDGVASDTGVGIGSGITTSMVVTGPGNVGIGTISPASRLDVVGQIAGTSIFGVLSTYELGSTGTPAAGFGLLNQFMLDNSVNSKKLAADFGAIWIDPTSGIEKGAFVIRTVSGGTALERLRIVDTGYVGIGTTLPGSTLDVKGTLRLSGASSGYVGLAPAAIAGAATYTFPTAVPVANSGYYLSSDTSGNLTWASAGGSAISALTSDVTASGTGSVAATVAAVGGSTATNVHAAELLANAATNINTVSTIVKRDASGNFTAGTITANLTGNATNVTGVVATANGGTGAAITGTTGGITYFNSATTMATSSQLLLNGIVLGGGTLAPATMVSTGTAGYLLTSGGVGLAPNWTATVPVANGGTGVATVATNLVFASPNGSTGAPSFRGLASADLPAGTGSLSGLTAATAGAHTIDNLNFDQIWNWSTATTQSPLTITANGLTTGSLLNLTTSNASVNSTNGLLNVANTGASTNGVVAKFQSNSTAGSGMVVLANGNVGIGITAPVSILDVNGSAGVKASIEGITSYVNSGTAYTIPDTSVNIRRITLNGNATITLPAFAAPTAKVYSLTVFVQQDATGSRTIAFVGNGADTVKWDGGTLPTISATANKITILQFTKPSDETFWYGSMVWREN